ncbi:hypothetical protein AAEX37_01245 [Oligella sp. MSHR50489EDL]|uniref:IS66 family insertion sequence element accessory protein TnpB n=1 Tax=Oligella sp. MSHR50489EDL TaxID=3139409 RepID=UPI003D81891A
MQYLMGTTPYHGVAGQFDALDCLVGQCPTGGLLRLDKIVLLSEPTDLRAGMDSLRTKAIQRFGQVAPHEAYLFMNRSQSLLKLLVHDAPGTWLCTRRLHEGRFHRAEVHEHPQLTAQALQALSRGLPWQRLGEGSIYRCS